MKQVKVTLPESEVALLDKIAKENNTTRAEVIRNNITDHGLTTGSLHRVAVAIRKRLHGVFTIQQAEQAAAIAICTIANESRSTMKP